MSRETSGYLFTCVLCDCTFCNELAAENGSKKIKLQKLKEPYLKIDRALLFMTYLLFIQVFVAIDE